MGRRANGIGPSFMRVLESSPIGHLWSFLQQTDANFAAIAEMTANFRTAGEGRSRAALISTISQLPSENLKPAETECGRVLLLCEGRGPDSCPPVLQRFLDSEAYETWDGQPDHLARALWLHVMHRRAFDDCVAFRNAREWRDAEWNFSALEVPSGVNRSFHGADVPEEEFREAVREKLGLTQRCGLSVIDLPENKHHPASVMLIVRHAGRLSSIAEHPKDGSRRLHYYLPQDEVVLIYSPSTQRIEVCGKTSDVRSTVSNTFAKVVLKHDVSKKPLNWANYDTSRFLENLELEAPEFEGFTVERVALTEIELRLGKREHRVRLRVPFKDDIKDLVEHSIGLRRGLRRALGVSRVSIAVRVIRSGGTASEILEFSISDRNRSTLSGLRDQELRQLGQDLLKHWDIVQHFKDLDTLEVADCLPLLAELFDLGEETVSAAFLEERGAPVRRLQEAGLLIRKGVDPVVVEDVDADADAPDLASHARYQVRLDWLEERLIGALHYLIPEKTRIAIDKHLTRIGTAHFSDGSVACYLCRGLTDAGLYIKLDGKLRVSSGSSPGIVLVGKDPGWRSLGPHVVVPILKSGNLPRHGQPLDLAEIEAAYRGGLEAAASAAQPLLEEHPGGLLFLNIPGRPALAVDGDYQKRAVRRLVDAHLRRQRGVETSKLIEGSSYGSVGQMFGRRWFIIKDQYIRNVQRKLWALSVE